MRFCCIAPQAGETSSGRAVFEKSWRWIAAIRIRAFWLNNHLPQSAHLIGITIKRQEPLPLKLLRQLEQLPALSCRQMQVCLMLAAGHSRPAIANRLDVSEHTAIAYTRQVYDKLQVHNRGELVNKLLLL